MSILSIRGVGICQVYSYVGSNTADIDEYPYYPYQPTGEPVRSRNDRVLIGVRLVPK